jgi:hypothetical protein
MKSFRVKKLEVVKMKTIIILILLVIFAGSCGDKGIGTDGKDGTSVTTGDTSQQEYNISIILLIGIAMSALSIYAFKKMLHSDKARIVRIECVKDEGFGGMTFSNTKTGKTMHIGYRLRIAVGEQRFSSLSMISTLPSSIEFKFAYVISTGEGYIAGGRVKLQSGLDYVNSNYDYRDIATGRVELQTTSSNLAIGEAFFPSKPYTTPFIGKAWIVKAYYDNGEVWINENADKKEEQAKRFINRKVNRLKL